MMNIKKVLLSLLVIIPILSFGLFAVWAYTPLGPMSEALDALESTPAVNVDNTSYITFTPTAQWKETGLIIYPGGRVDPRSYAPTAMEFAENGYLTIIVPMPFNLAVFGIGKASNVINQYPQVENWVIAGHSLGGSMAARYALENPEYINGLALWAAYPAGNDDFSTSKIITTSIFGTEDGLVGEEDISRAVSLLPDSNLFQDIIGGNHAQFGWYGDQSGDNPAKISRDVQQNILISTTLEILSDIEGSQ
jgi:hypothetical protein